MFVLLWTNLFTTNINFNLLDSVITVLDFLNKQSGILSLSAIIIAIIFFFIQQHNQKQEIKQEFKDRLKRACNLLLVDIEGWLKWINSEEYLLAKHNTGILYT